MYKEDPRRPFSAPIPDEIRDRASAASNPGPVTSQNAPRTAVRELGLLAAGTGLVVGAVVLGAVAGLVIAGAVIVLLGRSLVESDRT